MKTKKYRIDTFTTFVNVKALQKVIKSYILESDKVLNNKIYP